MKLERIKEEIVLFRGADSHAQAIPESVMLTIKILDEYVLLQ